MINTTNEHIAARLKALRERSGLRQHEVAYRAGVSSALISRIERGHINPSVKHLADIAAVFGQTPDLFLEDGDNPQGNEPSEDYDVQDIPF
jgi:transcriptional regulator with XRE-family HTH domain